MTCLDVLLGENSWLAVGMWGGSLLVIGLALGYLAGRYRDNIAQVRRS